MKKVKSFFLLFFIGVALISSAYAQNIEGNVTDAASGKGVEGASVVIKGGTIGTSMDASGHFSIAAKVNDVLVFSATGYLPQQVRLTSTGTLVAVFGTRGRGNSGTDMNAIPKAAVDRVEILRDDASAHYGSDAIAGVINLVLKKNTDKWQINLGGSGYYDEKYNPAFSSDLKNQYESDNRIDGAAFNFGVNKGFKLGDQGFINLSGNFFAHGKTYRQVLDTNLNNEDALPVNPGRRANADASVDSGGVMLNLETPFGSSSTRFYAFGGYNYNRRIRIMKGQGL